MFSTDQLAVLRQAEIERILPHLQPGSRILEVGAGTGQQAQILKQLGYDVEAIDIADSNYAVVRVFPVVDYDGRNIPFPDSSFDIVFSSNVLEHVPDLATMHAEVRRVLRPNGYAVHVMPTHAWRFWTTLSSFPGGLQEASEFVPKVLPHVPVNAVERRRIAKSLYSIAYFSSFGFWQGRHGERGNVISETWLFHPSWWRRNFRDHGFEIVADQPLGIFHTGNMVFGRRWSTNWRARISGILGSACHIFHVRPASRPNAAGKAKGADPHERGPTARLH